MAEVVGEKVQCIMWQKCSDSGNGSGKGIMNIASVGRIAFIDPFTTLDSVICCKLFCAAYIGMDMTIQNRANN